MITSIDADSVVNRKIQEDAYNRFNLRLSSEKPIRLPGGWRFPYDCFIGLFRIRQFVIIFFVDDEGSISEEWNDVNGHPNQEKIIDFLERVQSNEFVYPKLPSLQSILPDIQKSYEGAIIESVEVVWAFDHNSQLGLFWKIVVLRGIIRYIETRNLNSEPSKDRDNVTVGGEKNPFIASQSATEDWEMGRAKYRKRSNNLIVNFDDIRPDLPNLKSQWTVWAALNFVSEYLQSQEFVGFASHEVRIDYISHKKSTGGASFNAAQGIPTITFVTEGKWAEERSIVLHEIGHAFWSIMYARPPKGLTFEEFGREIKGIQEGFSDYFAMMFLSGERSRWFSVGKGLPKDVAKEYKLPRIISSSRHTSRDLAFKDYSQIDEHIIGHKWVNFLFDFRRQLLQRGIKLFQINKIILLAHIKPFPSERNGDFVFPTYQYFLSIRKMAKIENIDNLDNSFWDTIEKKHQLTKGRRGLNINGTCNL